MMRSRLPEDIYQILMFKGGIKYSNSNSDNMKKKKNRRLLWGKATRNPMFAGETQYLTSNTMKKRGEKVMENVFL